MWRIFRQHHYMDLSALLTGIMLIIKAGAYAHLAGLAEVFGVYISHSPSDDCYPVKPFSSVTWGLYNGGHDQWSNRSQPEAYRPGPGGYCREPAISGIVWAFSSGPVTSRLDQVQRSNNKEREAPLLMPNIFQGMFWPAGSSLAKQKKPGTGRVFYMLQ